MAFSKYLNHQGIDIARGLIVDTSHINKFGFTGTNANGTATVWDGNGTTAIYPYPVAGIVSVSSSSGTDDGETIEVQGLDDQFNAVTETLTIGSGTSTASFSRVFRARMITAGNVGTISIDQGVNLAAQILPSNSQTLMAVYTIPAGYTGYIAQFQGSVDKANVDVKFKLFCREPNDNGVFRLIGQWGTQGGNPVGYEYPVPLRVTEKSDLRVDVTTGAACGCGAIFDVILIKN
jgi:hypothetical protein